jgi:hypothetical protein
MPPFREHSYFLLSYLKKMLNSVFSNLADGGVHCFLVYVENVSIQEDQA